ncbi:hypothetical protein GSI_07178 [Ganoderma sinense ZZ0214-1]|uniref:Bromo domain-containing protein n=1 Tax=Ganoderma sinense ZZ0214-1 TaxID=1077348 RepID=A0A2G8S9P3_9APHY|nr:hypothetical protein GSI_07178 [Ganoderma sinense ZZ0214-1]
MSTPLDPLSPQSHIAVTPPAIRGSPSVLVPRLFKTGSPPPAPISPPPNGNVPAEPPGPSTFSAAQWCFSSSIIRTLRRMKTAGPFLNPVDPLELGIPHYPQVIERPMDFSTIERKLAASNPSKPDPNPTYARYYRVDQFVQDVRLVFANSVKFNGPEHPVTRMGKQVERIFDKQIKQMPPPEEPEAPTPVAGPPLFPPPSSSTSSPPSSPPPKKRARRPPVPVVLVIRRNKEPTGRPKREIRPPPRKDVLYTATSPALFKDKAPKNAVAAEQLKFCEKPARRAESLSTFTTPQVSSREHVNSASQRHALSVPAPNEADRNREQGSSASGLSASGQLPLPQWSLSDDPSTQSPSPPIRLPPLLPQTQRQHAQLQAVQKAVSAERERFKKTDDRNAHLTQVRRLFSDVFQAPADEDFYSVHVAAPREEVDRYLDGEGPGPDTGDLHFTDLEPYNNAWNCAVSRHLAHMVWDRQSTERWTTKKGGRAASASEAYWEDLILQKFKRVRKGWMDAQRKVVQDPATGQSHIESLEEAETRRFGKGEETRTVARQRERRFKRWERRTGICTTKMQLATVPFEKTRWTEFLKIIDILGKDGMSSDESTEEEVAKLPAAFYNDDWISTRSDEYVHGVLYGSDQGYEWVIRVAEAYNGRAANNS